MRPASVIQLTIALFAGLLCLGTIGLASSFFLAFYNDTSKIEIRLPAERIVSLVPHIPVEGTLTPGTGTPSQILTTWSQFRGDYRDAISTEMISLRRNWTDENPPPTLWGLPLGEGYAGFAVRNGRVYIKDYDEENQRDALRCLSLDNGEEIWRFSYPVAIKRNHGMSRTIPAVTDQYAVSIGPKCHVLCVDAITGEEKWLIDLRYIYGTVEPDWYAGQCPLIVTLPGRTDPSAIIAPAGPEVLMVALDCETGEEIWRTPNLFHWNMTHSSIVPMMLDDELTFVYLGDDGLVGVRAADGEILWSKTGWATALATCSSPVILSDDRIFFSGGYNRGSGMIQIVANPQGQYEANTLFMLDHAIFDTEQQTPIYYAEHIFGLRQRDKRFVCLDLSGQIVWESSRTERFGSGAYIVADGMILIVDDEGVLSGLRATHAGFHRYFEVQIMEDYACWAPMTIVQGRLLLRDQHSMKCIDLR
ncbi:MAG: PQQ-binding-like beta-propeller repeat protein [Planctomycetaceae bacterium]|nr:PQQ-binding-like beta-propeller repeat protein [Planctomycetaceae bacterium]